MHCAIFKLTGALSSLVKRLFWFFRTNSEILTVYLAGTFVLDPYVKNLTITKTANHQEKVSSYLILIQCDLRQEGATFQSWARFREHETFSLYFWKCCVLAPNISKHQNNNNSPIQLCFFGCLAEDDEGLNEFTENVVYGGNYSLATNSCSYFVPPYRDSKHTRTDLCVLGEKRRTAPNTKGSKPKQGMVWGGRTFHKAGSSPRQAFSLTKVDLAKTFLSALQAFYIFNLNGLFTLDKILLSVPFSDTFWSRICKELCQNFLSSVKFSEPLFCLSCAFIFFVPNLAQKRHNLHRISDIKISLFLVQNWHRKRMNLAQNFWHAADFVSIRPWPHLRTTQATPLLAA